MKIILDVYHRSMIVGNTQYCNTVAGFLDVIRLSNKYNMDDMFVIRYDSKNIFLEYMEKHAFDNNPIIDDFWIDVYLMPIIHWNTFRNEVIQDEVEQQELEDELWQAQYEDYWWQKKYGCNL